MSIGMTYDQYWYGDVRMTDAFRKAYKKKVEEKNYFLWLQGFYVYQAILDVAPILVTMPKKDAKVTPYAKEPIKIFDDEDKTKEEKEIQEENDALRMMLYMRQMVEAGKDWGKKE